MARGSHGLSSSSLAFHRQHRVILADGLSSGPAGQSDLWREEGFSKLIQHEEAEALIAWLLGLRSLLVALESRLAREAEPEPDRPELVVLRRQL